MDQSHEKALAILNDTQKQLASTIRAIISSLEDGKVDSMEGFMLGMKGMNLAMFAIGTLKALDTETRKDVLYVLENGEWIISGG